MIIVFFSTYMIFSTSGTLYLGSGWYLVGEPLPRSSCGNWNWSRKRIGSIYRRLFVLILIVSLTRQTHLPHDSYMWKIEAWVKGGLVAGVVQYWNPLPTSLHNTDQHNTTGTQRKHFRTHLDKTKMTHFTQHRLCNSISKRGNETEQRCFLMWSVARNLGVMYAHSPCINNSLWRCYASR